MTTDIEDVLLDRLAAEVHDVRVPDELLAAAFRRHRRRRATIVAGAGTATLAATCVVAAAALTPGPHDVAPPVPPGRRAPQLTTIGDIRPRILHALDASDAITETSWRTVDRPGPSGPAPLRGTAAPSPTGSPNVQVDDNWRDPATGYVTTYTYDNGKLTRLSSYNPGKGGTATTVDYRTRTYYRTYQGPVPTHDGPLGKLGEPELDDTAGIRAALTLPGIRIVGHGTVHGVETTHLRYVLRRHGSTVTGDAWFDATTYTPIKSTMDYDGDAVCTTRFLPRTKANVATARLTIPAGFREVTPPGNR